MRRRNFLKSHHSRRYTTERYKNPYFSDTKKFSWKKWLLILSIATTISIGIPWLCFALPWFYVNTVTVEGSITLRPDEIRQFALDRLEERRWDVIPQNHIWLFDERRLREDLLRQFSLNEVSVVRNGRTTSISVQERVTSLIWAHGEVLYFVDQEGWVVRELTEGEVNDVRSLLYNEGERQYQIQSENIFVVFQQDGGDVSQNTQVLSANAVGVLTFINEHIERYQLVVESIEMTQPLSHWATVNLRGGLDVYLDLQGSGENQLANLEVILDEYSSRLEGIEYIDLRFGNRVFVK